MDSHSLTVLLIPGAIPPPTMKNTDKPHFTDEFEQLYHCYAGKLYNYVLKLSHGNKYLAEEITQITFLKVWERREYLGTPSLLTSYLFATARNTFFNVCEHQAIEYVYFNYILDTRSESDSSMEDDIDYRSLLDGLWALVAQMPPMRRRVFLMSRQYHLSNKQIAEELGISVSTVETHIMLALRFLHEHLSSRTGLFAILACLLAQQ